MTFLAAVHIVQYAVDLRGVNPHLRESWLAEKGLEHLSAPVTTFEEFSGIDFDAVLDEQGRSLFAAYLEERELNNNPIDAIRLRFESAFMQATQNHTVIAERGAVMLPHRYLADPGYMPDDEELWEKAEHITNVALRQFEENGDADWLSADFSIAHGNVARFYKLSAWQNGRPLPLFENGEIQYTQGPAPVRVTSHTPVLVDDAAVNPALQSSLRHTPFMGYFTKPITPRPDPV